MKSKSREILNEKLKKCGELYSSTIIDGIIKINPDLDLDLIKLIKDLLVVGYTDGSRAVLDMIEKVIPSKRDILIKELNKY